MNDSKKSSDDLAARAVLAAGKEAAERALDGILPPDKAAPDDKGKEKPGSSRAYWIIAGIVVAALVVVGVIGLVLTYWKWFLLAGVLGVAALYGFYRARTRLRDRKQPKQPEAVRSKADADERPKVRVAKPSEPDAATTAKEKEREADIARLRELETAREAAVERETRAAREREVDDELAAMKARIKRDG